MKIHNLKRSWIAPLVLIFFFAACKGKNRDAEIQSAINAKTASEARMAGVSAAVVDGVVTIMGNCADESCRTNAENEIKEVDGVEKVVNNITVAPAREVSDKDLRNGAEDIVKKYRNVQATVNEGVITLRGQADKDKLQQLMMDLHTLHPKRIENQLVIE